MIKTMIAGDTESVNVIVIDRPCCDDMTLMMSTCTSLICSIYCHQCEKIIALIGPGDDDDDDEQKGAPGPSGSDEQKHARRLSDDKQTEDGVDDDDNGKNFGSKHETSMKVSAYAALGRLDQRLACNRAYATR